MSKRAIRRPTEEIAIDRVSSRQKIDKYINKKGLPIVKIKNLTIPEGTSVTDLCDQILIKLPNSAIRFLPYKTSYVWSHLPCKDEKYRFVSGPDFAINALIGKLNKANIVYQLFNVEF